MKKLLVLVLSLCAVYGYGQTTISFCTSIEQSGYCYFNNTKFIAQQDSQQARIFMQVRGKTPLATTQVTYKIYTDSSNTAGHLIASLNQNVQPDWYSAWMPYNFTSGGKYNVKVTTLPVR